MKKYLIIIATLSLIPSVAFAAWWNPLSWGIFSFLQPNPQVQIISTTTASDQTPVDDSATTSIPIIPTTAVETPTAPVSNPPKTVKKVSTPVAIPVPSTSAIPAVSICPQGYNCAPTTSSVQPQATVAPVSASPQSCTNGFTFDKSANECVTMLAYCQNRNGSNATYNSVNNSCSCATGYALDSNNTCSVQQTGSQICSAMNGTWHGTYGSNGKYNCTCNTGYVSGSDGKSCVLPGTPYKAVNGNCYYPNAYDSSGNPLQTSCPVQLSQPASVSAACQQAKQAVQTAQNQYNTLEAQNPLSNISNNPNALANLGTGSAGNMTIAIEQNLQGLAQVVTYALEEEQIACQ